MGKFFTTTIKPTITASKQTVAFADTDVLFDWTAFDIPRGANRLVQSVALIRGTNGAAQTMVDIELFFAKSINTTAPTTLGDLNDPADTPGWFNNLIAKSYFDVSTNNVANDADLKFMNVLQNNMHQRSVVLEGEPVSGTNVGYDKLYVAGIVKGALDFSTAVLTTGAVDVSDIATATVGSLDNGSGGSATCANKFVVGDVIHVQDDIILGEIASIDSATALTFRHDGKNDTPDGLANWRIQNGADAAGDLANNDELYNIHPITLILSFEK